MQLKKIVIASAMALGMASFAHAADQGHGTVTFTGSIIDAPCSIAPESIDQTVNLGQVSNASLADAGTSTPRNFQIKLEKCTLSTAKNVTTTFTGAEGASGRLGITGTAKGASIVLTDGAGAAIQLGNPTAAQALQDGNNTLSFSAYLQGDGKDASDKEIPVVPGEFQSIADFTLAYQ